VVGEGECRCSEDANGGKGLHCKDRKGAVDDVMIEGDVDCGRKKCRAAVCKNWKGRDSKDRSTGTEMNNEAKERRNESYRETQRDD
jgi:hypothetical protein